MKYIVTASEMKQYDCNTSEYYGVPSMVLMERAALAMADTIERYFPKGGSVLIVCGRGNNGGDGLAAGRILLQRGFSVSFFQPEKGKACSEQTGAQLAILQKYGKEPADAFGNDEYDIIIDALFGVGLTRKIEGVYETAVRQMNDSKAMVFSCDIPSGINSDNGSVMGTAVRADITVTFAFGKRGLFCYPGAEYAGSVLLRDIGIDEMSFRGTPPEMAALEAADLSLLPRREENGNKGTFGKVFVIAGSCGMSGACELCARSAYRSGAGMVKIMTAEENRQIIQKNLPEALLTTYHGAVIEAEEVTKGVCWADSIAIGPGLSTGDTAKELVRTLLSADLNHKVLVMDADALNLLADGKDRNLWKLLTKQVQAGVQVMMTPHLGEFSRLTGKTISEIKEAPVSYALAFAEKYGITLVLKDAVTLTAYRDGRLFLNQTGNNGMATAGSGDVLTGILAGLAAEYRETENIAAYGVMLHGLAGDKAQVRLGAHGMMAHDITEEIGAVLKEAAL